MILLAKTKNSSRIVSVSWGGSPIWMCILYVQIN